MKNSKNSYWTTKGLYYLLALVVLLFSYACTSNIEQKQALATDQKEPISIGKRKEIAVFQTAQNLADRLALVSKVQLKEKSQPLEVEKSIFVNPNNTFQKFLGIGGAITDASAEVFAQLSEENQEKLIQAYYGPKGIGYSLIRTPIHSCDFSSGSFTYVEEGDSALQSFTIEHDRKYRIPMIKRALKAAGGIPLYASPWSPPSFMKTNGQMLQGGKLKPQYYQSWANYYAKFIEAYEQEGMPIWGITIQNEPMATQRWESCIYSAEEERDFLKNYLGPTLEKSGYGDKKIVVWDHNRDLIPNRANVIFDDPEASKYAWGIGFHWYETWAGGTPLFDNLGSVKEAYPDKQLLFTEGCNEAFDAEKYQYWPNAERYGRSMINDFNKGTVGWTDWNILLNQNGGPNHVGNYCFAPIHGDVTSDSLVFTPSYYYIGHFSKFVQKGAVRLGTSTSHSNLMSCSWKNEAGGIATIVMNPTEETIEYALYIEGQEAHLKIPARAIQTLVY